MLQCDPLFMKIRSHKGGFSLLEMMLAILLFGTGLAFLLQIVSTGLFVGVQNEDTIIAANLAQEKIEELRNTAYASLASTTPAVAVTGFTGFTREVLVGDLTPAQAGLKKITVKVNWPARNNVMTTTMVTYVSNV
jgi:prepilin-type N-terminal cleavage/methylation domain-containing protein